MPLEISKGFFIYTIGWRCEDIYEIRDFFLGVLFNFGLKSANSLH